MTAKYLHLPNEQVQISTPRLLLRPAIDHDSTALFESFSDPNVMRYWSEPPHKDIERTREWVSNMMTSPQNGTTDFIIMLKSTTMPIGKIGIWQDSEIGFMLNAAYWREGLGREALDAVVEYSFNERGFEEITADTDPRNEASIALLKRVGFEITGFQEKTLEIGGEWVGSCYLRLKKDNWKGMGENVQ